MTCNNKNLFPLLLCCSCFAGAIELGCLAEVVVHSVDGVRSGGRRGTTCNSTLIPPCPSQCLRLADSWRGSIAVMLLAQACSPILPIAYRACALVQVMYDRRDASNNCRSTWFTPHAFFYPGLNTRAQQPTDRRTRFVSDIIAPNILLISPRPDGLKIDLIVHKRFHVRLFLRSRLPWAEQINKIQVTWLLHNAHACIQRCRYIHTNA